MLDQEIASIIRFTLEKADSPSAYYWNVPEGFLIPSAFFPVPEVESGGYTLNTYAITFTMFIKFFCIDKQSAYDLAFGVLAAINRCRCKIPLIDADGEQTGRKFRIKNPSARGIEGETGTAQLTVTWESPRSYDTTEAEKIMEFDLNMHLRGAYAEATGQQEPIQSEESDCSENL